MCSEIFKVNIVTTQVTVYELCGPFLSQYLLCGLDHNLFQMKDDISPSRGDVMI